MKVRWTTSSYNFSSGSATSAPSSLATAAATASIVDIPSERRCSRSLFLYCAGAGSARRGIVHKTGMRAYNRRACLQVASRTTTRSGGASGISELIPSGQSSHVPGFCSSCSSGGEKPRRSPPPQEKTREFGNARAASRPVLLRRSASAICRRIRNFVRVCTVGRIGQMQISRRI